MDSVDTRKWHFIEEKLAINFHWVYSAKCQCRDGATYSKIEKAVGTKPRNVIGKLALLLSNLTVYIDVIITIITKLRTLLILEHISRVYIKVVSRIWWVNSSYKFILVIYALCEHLITIRAEYVFKVRTQCYGIIKYLHIYVWLCNFIRYLQRLLDFTNNK